MSKKIYVGNLSYNTTETQVKDLFEEYGSVQSIAWITDRDTGRFRGFAFVEMEESSANAAIKSLNNQLVDGRELRVNEAKPKKDDNRGKSNRNRGYDDRW
ncbi:MAG: RNA-binding protein [Anaerolineae bacterium]|nr:MAG: RNA-binding protein [Anaerolineae bacterium]